MRKVLQKFDRIFKYIRQKKLPVSGGSVVFFIFTAFLIIGCCKFSFYVLKNHHNVVERNALVKTYIDVQPYQNQKEHIYIKSENKRSSSFLPIRKENDFYRRGASPSELFGSRGEKEHESAVDSINKTTGVVDNTSIKAKKTIQSESDNLMASGLTLLNESEEKIASSELLLRDEAPVKQENAPAEKKVRQLPVEKKEVLPFQKKVKKFTDKTRWLNTAELRRQLMLYELENLLPKQEETKPSVPVLKTAEEKQVAQNAVAPKPSPVKEKEKEVIPEQKEVPVKEEKQAVLNDTPPVPVQAEEKKELYQKPLYTASDDSADTAKEIEARAISAKKRKTMAGNSPSLWKVAKVRNDSANKSTDESKEKKLSEQETTLKTEKNASDQKDLNNHSLNWLDRQNAAVWVSMSQSDVPSVWSATTEKNTSQNEQVKAFRVADEKPEQQEPNVVNSAPVRVIGEEKNKEIKENPILLPLGDQNVKKQPEILSQNQANPAPSASRTAAPNINMKSVMPSFAGNAPSQDPTVPNEEESGLMNKFFSFFNKPDADGGLPQIGSGTPVKSDTENKTQSRQDALQISKPAGQVSSSSSKKDGQVVIPTELRLTFKPGSAEISSQSVKWIKAFAQRAKKDIQNAVEVRMSNVEPVLQEKRFALIRNSLVGSGVDANQIVPVITDRTPHTIVLRMIALPEEGLAEYTTDSNGIRESLYYKKW